MKILMATSEAVPFAKSGGLGDMVSALSIALAQLGHEVKIILPRYFFIDRESLTPLDGPLGVPVGGGEAWAGVYKSLLPGSEKITYNKKKNPVETYFIDHEGFFGRDGIYGTPYEPDFLDNARRYSFFSRAVFQCCRKIKWYPEIVHCHDWPTSMAAVYLKFAERVSPANTAKAGFAKAASVLTIHNLGYQGIYSKDNFNYMGLGWDVFYKAGFEDWNMLNLLKAGLYSADKLNTVSPSYAQETLGQAGGSRLDGVLRLRQADYSGILNGIDTEAWNPAKDKNIPLNYSTKEKESIDKGKAAAKKALQKEFNLPPEPNMPLIGMVTRLTGQKGVGELFGPAYGSAYSICRDMKVQFVILGSGEAWCENELRSLASKLSNFRCKIGYSEKLSHLIEAGSDFFLMPSMYEPCGLNQMYSLNYGTLPIVRNTGGLADTVENYNQEKGSGTGFMFDQLNPSAIYNTVGWAVWAYYNKKKDIEAMRLRGMKKNFAWAESAKKYVELYRSALA
jgi:starch synthase